MHLIHTVLPNFETLRQYELKLSVHVYVYILVIAYFFKLIMRSFEYFGFHLFCIFYLKFSCKNDMSIAKM